MPQEIKDILNYVSVIPMGLLFVWALYKKYLRWGWDCERDEKTVKVLTDAMETIHLRNAEKLDRLEAEQLARLQNRGPS